MGIVAVATITVRALDVLNDAGVFIENRGNSTSGEDRMAKVMQYDVQRSLNAHARPCLHSLMCKKAARMLSACVFTFALALFSPPDASAANSDKPNPAETFVQNGVDKGHAILNDPTVSVGERESRFRAHLLTIIDLKRVSAFTLGPYARGAPIAAIASFENAFAEFVSAVYQRSLDVDGQTIRVTGSIARAADDVIVTADVIRATVKEAPSKIAFRVRKTDSGNDAVTDFQAEGVWLALTQRDDFTAYLQQHGGDILQLAEELESRTDRIRAGAAARSSSG
jgi:phospholipid transport system substrate-binding protein